MLGQSAAASTVFSGATLATGGTITFDGNYKIHTFSTIGTGSFVIQSIGQDNAFDVLVVAGGGGGGHGSNITNYGFTSGSGGGGGGVIYQESRSLSTGTYQVIVGAGGPGNTFFTDPLLNGDDSALGTLVAKGGGGGGTMASGRQKGNDGGSGGGAAGGTNDGGTNCATVVPSDYDGIATQPTQSGDSGTYGFGTNGGLPSNCSNRTVAPLYAHYRDGGGGGGAGGAANLSVGGSGKTVSITGTAVEYAKGGTAGSGLTGAANTGNGGAGDSAGGFTLGTGGSGIVVIRYLYQ